MKRKNWKYIGEPIPDIDAGKNADFLLKIQTGMLSSLAKRGLITFLQAEKIKENIENKAAKRKF